MFDFETRAQISKIARQLGVEPAVLLAVAEVESAGKTGTIIKGQFEPLIRFEGHYFHRLLPKHLRNKARKLQLAHPVAGRIKNPKSQARRWALLERAIRIDRKAALSSISWGLGQVMGAHWEWLGYESIDALANEARRGVVGQVQLMARFIDKSGLTAKLKAHDWAGFARGYNGPAYRKNRYDSKMARAYKRHSKAGKMRPLLKQGAKGDAVRTLQRLLGSAGFATMVDGIFGPATSTSVKEFQLKYGLVVDGTVGPNTWARLYSRPEGSSAAVTQDELSGIKKSFRRVTKRLRHFFRL